MALDGCCQWFCGGTKELKATLPAWSKLEPKLEVLVEFVQVLEDMHATLDEPASWAGDFDAKVAAVKLRYNTKRRCWGSVLSKVRNGLRQHARHAKTPTNALLACL